MQQRGPGAGGRLEIHPEIAALTTSCHVDGADDVLEEPDAGTRVHVQLDGDEAHGGDDLVVVGADHLTALLGRDADPLPGHLHHRLGVHQPVAVVMRHSSSHPIQLPVRGVEVGRVGGPDHDVLHVAPCQVRVGLQGQRDDGGSHGSASAGAYNSQKIASLALMGCNI